MKKIVGLAVVFMFSIIAVNAQEKKTISVEEEIIGVPPDIVVEDGPQGPNHVYSVVGLQVKPSFPGSFQSEVQKGMNPTDNGAPSPFKGRVYVNFIIEKDGSLSNVRYTRDPGYGFGKEVKEAVEKVQIKWSPGLQDGKPVRVSYTLPVEINVP